MANYHRNTTGASTFRLIHMVSARSPGTLAYAQFDAGKPPEEILDEAVSAAQEPNSYVAVINLSDEARASRATLLTLRQRQHYFEGRPGSWHGLASDDSAMRAGNLMT
jgi:hypothetical protein